MGDQPEAIQRLVTQFKNGEKFQTLLGVTGSGKTFSMANIINQLGKKALIIAHNKTLAAQLYAEFKEFFPNNKVEYFVSYYDYYQPEAYVASSDTFIEKDASINEEIDKLRHSTTKSLLSEDVTIVVSSVSCIYGIGDPDEYKNQRIVILRGEKKDRDQFLAELVNIQYTRNDIEFERGTFRVRGDVVEVFPPSEDSQVYRVEFFGKEIEGISVTDPLTGETLYKTEIAELFPSSHYVVGLEKQKKAVETIRAELQLRLAEFKKQDKLVEYQRLKERTLLDLEMLETTGFCSGIENYSRHFTGLKPGEPPPTLVDFFKKDFLLIVDESHMTIPQIGAMYRGDQSRKKNLIDFGFRLPSAADNRPLTFKEFESKLDQVLYVSATPADFEIEKSKANIVEQVIRPTGLIDPEVFVRTAKNQVQDLLTEAKKEIKKGHRVLITTLTKKSAEELTEYYQAQGMKVKYLHSDIETLERIEILNDLRAGVFDILVGINLLREGLDLPEVSLVAVLDADKEGFLRSDRALIQTIGRAARNSEGFVILYADKITRSMKSAMDETLRRRKIQQKYNEKHNITPKTIVKGINGGIVDVLRGVKAREDIKKSIKRAHLSQDEVEKQIKKLQATMKKLVKKLQFEEAARVRDEINELKQIWLVSGKDQE